MKDEIQSQRIREEEVAKNIIEHADKAKAWSKHFLDTELIDTTLDKNDVAQKAISKYSDVMGLPEHGHALTDNLGRWCKALSSYIVEKQEGGSKHKETERQRGDMPRIKMEKVIKPRQGDLRELMLPGGGDSERERMSARMLSNIGRVAAAKLSGAAWHF